MNTVLEPASIGYMSIDHLAEKRFVIPSYQRGYKWRKTDVEYLIKDIAGIKEDDGDYCLQPVVVAQEGDSYILVDGQQRLTTIWLISTWTRKHEIQAEHIPHFFIQYGDGRGDSNKYLQDLEKDGAAHDTGTCDTHYFAEAVMAIQENRELLKQFFRMLHKVKVIWYVIDKDEGPSKFERLNSSRIGLTNAELVKALILTTCDSTSRGRIACEWDTMEYSLQDNVFFSFLTPRGSTYQKEYNRIELVLDLYTEVSKSDREKDEYATYNRIVDKIGQKTSDSVWQEICNVYRRLESWYCDKDNFLYNMIGFLVQIESANTDKPILLDLWKFSRNTSVPDFKNHVRELVIKQKPKDVNALVYKSPDTFKTLLLFNILSMMSVHSVRRGKDTVREYSFNDKFHFDLFQSQRWDKEHIHASASEPLKSRKEWAMWMRDIRPEYDEIAKNNVAAKSVLEEINSDYWFNCAGMLTEEQVATLDHGSNIDNTPLKGLTQSIFSRIYQEVITSIEGPVSDDDPSQNSIGNLALLDRGTNRSYKAEPFSTKRRVILSRIREGVFVPIATQNVFQKFYTEYPDHFYKWEKQPHDGKKSDREYHIDAIEETLSRLV